MAPRFVLLDRDGTIIYDEDYLSDPAGVRLLPGAASGMRKMLAAGWRIVIITNQSGIGRGYFSEIDYQAVTARLKDLLAKERVRIEGIYHCPHAPDVKCECRKPLTGLAEAAAAELGFSLSDCVVAGDKPADVNLGKNIGGKGVLVRTGYGRKHELNGDCSPDFIADDLNDVAEYLKTL